MSPIFRGHLIGILGVDLGWCGQRGPKVWKFHLRIKRGQKFSRKQYEARVAFPVPRRPPEAREPQPYRFGVQLEVTPHPYSRMDVMCYVLVCGRVHVCVCGCRWINEC